MKLLPTSNQKWATRCTQERWASSACPMPLSSKNAWACSWMRFSLDNALLATVEECRGRRAKFNVQLGMRGQGAEGRSQEVSCRLSVVRSQLPGRGVANDRPVRLTTDH